MGYKDSYEAYINLSRRELQGLCKKHNLPANRTRSDLANALASYFKKKNSSLANTGETSSIPAKVNAHDKTRDKNPDENENKCDKRLGAEDGNELKARRPISIESSQEGVKIVGAVDGIVDNPNSSGNLLRDQDFMFEFPMMGEEQTPPLEPSPDNIKPQPPNKVQNQEQAPQFACSDKSTVRFAAESSTVTETTERPAFFQFFVASEEGISLFVDLNSGPSDWVHRLKGNICRNPVRPSCSIGSLVNDANSSRTSALCEKFPSESVPVESIHNLSDIPTQIENKLGGIQDGEENEEMQLSKTVKGDSKEVGGISVCELNSLVQCQNGIKLAEESTDPATKGLSVPGPVDKVVDLDSSTEDSLFPSSDVLADLSAPKASDSSGLTQDKNLKRALDQGSEKLSQSFRVTLDKNLKRVLNQGGEKLSQNKKHHVAEEINKNLSSTRILRSSKVLVKEAEEDKISGLPRRSTRLVSKMTREVMQEFSYWFSP